MDFIYSWILKLFGWSSFLTEQNENLRSMAASFQQFFITWGCGTAFMVLLSLTFVASICYYFSWCNGSSKKFQYRFRIKWWFIWMLFTAIITAIITLITLFVVEGFLLNNNQLGEKFFSAVSICNGIYSPILFFIFSLLITRLGGKYTNASCTPC